MNEKKATPNNEAAPNKSQTKAKATGGGKLHRVALYVLMGESGGHA